MPGVGGGDIITHFTKTGLFKYSTVELPFREFKANGTVP
jgi:hypothetical protein